MQGGRVQRCWAAGLPWGMQGGRVLHERSATWAGQPLAPGPHFHCTLTTTYHALQADTGLGKADFGWGSPTFHKMGRQKVGRAGQGRAAGKQPAASLLPALLLP